MTNLDTPSMCGMEMLLDEAENMVQYQYEGAPEGCLVSPTKINFLRIYALAYTYIQGTYNYPKQQGDMMNKDEHVNVSIILGINGQMFCVVMVIV